MPVEWAFADDVVQLGGSGRHKISAEDGHRQQVTARAILEALREQPGVILADEVGMGKTYVALGVVASVLLATRHEGRPVVVMTPPGLARKWPREWEQFKNLCCTPAGVLDWVRDEYVASPAAFFKFLDDPRSRRPHLVWMTTGCFYHGLNDPWIKLALLRLARGQTRLSESMRGRLFKWAASLVRLKSWSLREEIFEWLLSHKISEWGRYLRRQGKLSEEADEPIPAALLRNAMKLDFRDWLEKGGAEQHPGLATLLHDGTIPGRTGKVSSATEREARDWINEACQHVYRQWIQLAEWRSPLLVLDEAHHAKNDNTRLASLFRRPEHQEEVALLDGRFDRMLFLTATPFQLGHEELIRVLRSFSAVKCAGPYAPIGTGDDFETAMTELQKRLDENRFAAKRLDRLWGRLPYEQVCTPGPRATDLTETAAGWWERASSAPADAFEEELVRAVDETRRTKERAERDPNQPRFGLHSWVIRHNRSAYLPRDGEGADVPRRESRPGVAILANEDSPIASSPGIPLEGDAALPFLLAARAQGELAGGSKRARAYFAEGLCSSYEAFHHTREERADVRDVDDDGIALVKNGRASSNGEESIVPVSWYETQIERLIPSRKATEEERCRHPKMRAVVDRVVQKWQAGEKVLVFCFYRETARALRTHLGREVEQAVLRLTAQKLGLNPDREADTIRGWLARISRRLADERSPFYREIRQQLEEPLQREEFAILRPKTEDLIGLLAAYVRSPSFVARYFPLEVPEVREALSGGETRPPIIRVGVNALRRAITEQADGSALTMARRVEEFLRFAKDHAERGQRTVRTDSEGDGDEASDPLSEYLDAVAAYVSPRRAKDDDDVEAQQPEGGDDGTYRVLPTVRMVYGDTKREIRERLMLAFNRPLFPEILVSSAVLGEGVDLHRFCRHVIHHDLCWNPSTLEQRTGRLDRIRCKAEVARRPIVVYEPFLAGSADEKMFRVVRDRERWFQIVMGQKFEFDEATSEALANRVPLPIGVANRLVFDLRRWQG